jgi:trehalose/maltose hydrolase-like predicted phosphorylase
VITLYSWKGLEVLIGIARFWHQRANFSKDKINM